MPIPRAPRSLLLLPLLLGCGANSAPKSADDAGDDITGSTAAASTPSTSADPTTLASTGETPTTGETDPCATSPQALADCVDPAAYADDLNFIADIRTPGSPHWQAVQDLCADRLGELGYQVQLQDYGSGINVLGMRPGTVNPEQFVVVGAHYDHIPDCHGADDNATGVAATLEIARVLAKSSFERSTVIACWDEEEDGLVGSKAFIAALGGKEVVVDFNFDMIGVRSDEPNSQTVPPGFELVFADAYAELQTKEFRGDFIAIVTSDAAKDHALAFAAASDRVTLPRALLPLPAGGETSEAFADLRRSDHAAFWDAGLPAVFITDTGDFRNDHYHCMGGPDEVADLDLDFATNVTRATVEASAVALKM